MRKSILFILCIVFSLMVKAEYNGLKLWASDYNLPIFYYLPVNNETLMECLLYYKVKFPDIVFAQAILETGHFKSNACINNNNLFGLGNEKVGWKKFNYWIESVKYYIQFVQSRYKPPNEDYYKFLSKIGYAKDKKYIQKLKQITYGYNSKVQKTRMFCY